LPDKPPVRGSSLIEAQQLLALAQEDLQTRERALDLTQRRYDAGIISIH
jgi:outer membrane protein TolC